MRIENLKRLIELFFVNVEAEMNLFCVIVRQPRLFVVVGIRIFMMTKHSAAPSLPGRDWRSGIGLGLIDNLSKYFAYKLIL